MELLVGSMLVSRVQTPLDRFSLPGGLASLKSAMRVPIPVECLQGLFGSLQQCDLVLQCYSATTAVLPCTTGVLHPPQEVRLTLSVVDLVLALPSLQASLTRVDPKPLLQLLLELVLPPQQLLLVLPRRGTFLV